MFIPSFSQNVPVNVHYSRFNYIHNYAGVSENEQTNDKSFTEYAFISPYSF